MNVRKQMIGWQKVSQEVIWRHFKITYPLLPSQINQPHPLNFASYRLDWKFIRFFYCLFNQPNVDLKTFEEKRKTTTNY